MQETKKETYETPQLEKQEPLQDMTNACYEDSGGTDVCPPT